MKAMLRALAAVWLTTLAAHALTDAELSKAGFEQKLSGQVPLDVTLRDETGADVRLGAYFGSRPVILALAYYDCPSLCTLVLNGVLESARNLKLEAGKDFEIVVVSIRPDEAPALAAAKKQTYTLRYGRPGSAKGWHFLTGGAASIAQVADAVGFHYVYDPGSNQFAHASGMVVLTPAGRISRYFLGIEYPPKEVRLALVEASQHRIGTLAERLYLLCFHYNPATGRYGLVITRAVQAGGIGTVLLLGALVLRMNRKAGRRMALPS